MRKKLATFAEGFQQELSVSDESILSARAPKQPKKKSSSGSKYSSPIHDIAPPKYPDHLSPGAKRHEPEEAEMEAEHSLGDLENDSWRSKPKLQRHSNSERMHSEYRNSARHMPNMLDLANLNLNANTMNVMLPTVITKEDRDEKAQLKKVMHENRMLRKQNTWLLQ